MDEKPDILDYAPANTPHRGVDWQRFAPFFMLLCACFAWLKSMQYHRHGHLPHEQVSTLVFVFLSLPCLVLTLARLRRYKADGRVKLISMMTLCVFASAADAAALWNLHTARGYRLF